MDELGRGTSTHDGVAIAYATLHYLVAHVCRYLNICGLVLIHAQIQCMTLFVTHYPLLANLSVVFPREVGNYHMAFMNVRAGGSGRLDTQADDDDASTTTILFLYQLVRGAAERSYGINVARLAGYI